MALKEKILTIDKIDEQSFDILPPNEFVPYKDYLVIKRSNKVRSSISVYKEMGQSLVLHNMHGAALIEKSHIHNFVNTRYFLEGYEFSDFFWEDAVNYLYQNQQSFNDRLNALFIRTSSRKRINNKIPLIESFTVFGNPDGNHELFDRKVKSGDYGYTIGNCFPYKKILNQEVQEQIILCNNGYQLWTAKRLITVRFPYKLVRVERTFKKKLTINEVADNLLNTYSLTETLENIFHI